MIVALPSPIFDCSSLCITLNTVNAIRLEKKQICQMERTKFAGGQVLIDPVCLLTIYPQLLRNFLYKIPNLMRFGSLNGVIDWMRYVFSRDLLIAEVCVSHGQHLFAPFAACVHGPCQYDVPMLQDDKAS